MKIKEWIEKIIYNEMSSGILMIIALMTSIWCANSVYRDNVEAFFHTQLFLGLHNIKFSRPLEWWISDVLMVFFFLQIGLELKREMREGFLSDIKQLSVPAIAAAGGIICPAIIYLLFNAHSQEYINGWAIPTATDIAFAICIIMLVGSTVPKAAKIFLLAIAIFDDLGAILIIALFYNKGVSIDLLGYAGLSCIGLYLLNKMQITNFALYFIFGTILWYCFLNGGIHTTMAGVVVAMAYPMRVNIKKYSPLERLSHKLKPWVDLIILPIFAFASAGLYLGNITAETFTHTLTLGIIFGLFLGKQIGIFSITWLLIKTKIAKFPTEVSLLDLYGVASVAGVGFTMALFIGKLSLPISMQEEIRLGILCGSGLSAVWAGLIFQLDKYLHKTKPQPIPQIIENQIV